MDDLDARYARLRSIGPLPTDRPLDRRLSAIEQMILSSARAFPRGFGMAEAGLRLRGALDVPALRRAVDLLNERYDILRTSYLDVDGAPTARIAASVPGDLRLVDCSAGGEAMAAEVAARERAAAFDFDRAPLMRFVLLELGEQDHQLHHFVHHLVGDARAFVLVHRDLAAAYAGCRRRDAPTLRAPLLQYRDVVAWEQAWRTPELEAEYRDFWRSQLGDEPTAAPLATMKARPVSQLRFRCASTLFEFPAHDTAKLMKRSAERRWPLPNAVLAGLVAVLHDEGQGDAVVVIHSGNRRRETMFVVGNFSTLVPVRIPAQSGEPLADLFDRTCRTVATALRYQDLTPAFAALLGRTSEDLHALLRGDVSATDVRPPRGGSRVMFNYWGMAGVSLELDGIESVDVDLYERSHMMFDLDFSCSLTKDDRLSIHVEYNSELITAAQIETLLERFRRTLQSASD